MSSTASPSSGCRTLPWAWTPAQRNTLFSHTRWSPSRPAPASWCRTGSLQRTKVVLSVQNHHIAHRNINTMQLLEFDGFKASIMPSSDFELIFLMWLQENNSHSLRLFHLVHCLTLIEAQRDEKWQQKLLCHLLNELPITKVTRQSNLWSEDSKRPEEKRTSDGGEEGGDFGSGAHLCSERRALWWCTPQPGSGTAVWLCHPE